jgi:hypothetical protein
MAGRWNRFLNKLLERGKHAGPEPRMNREPQPVSPPVIILPPNPSPDTPIAIVYGDDYWQERAEELLQSMDVEYYYGVDHSQPNWLGATYEEYMALGEQIGWRELVRNLLLKQRMQNLYWNDAPGDRDEATDMWLETENQPLPYWFWSYHGIYA